MALLPGLHQDRVPRADGRQPELGAVAGCGSTPTGWSPRRCTTSSRGRRISVPEQALQGAGGAGPVHADRRAGAVPGPGPRVARQPDHAGPRGPLRHRTAGRAHRPEVAPAAPGGRPGRGTPRRPRPRTSRPGTARRAGELRRQRVRPAQLAAQRLLGVVPRQHVPGRQVVQLDPGAGAAQRPRRRRRRTRPAPGTCARRRR